MFCSKEPCVQYFLYIFMTPKNLVVCVFKDTTPCLPSIIQGRSHSSGPGHPPCWQDDPSASGKSPSVTVCPLFGGGQRLPNGKSARPEGDMLWQGKEAGVPLAYKSFPKIQLQLPVPRRQIPPKKSTKLKNSSVFFPKRPTIGDNFWP